MESRVRDVRLGRGSDWKLVFGGLGLGFGADVFLDPPPTLESGLSTHC